MIVTEAGNRRLRIEEEKVMEVLSVTSKNSFLEKCNLSLCHQDKSESKFNKKINKFNKQSIKFNNKSVNSIKNQ